MASIILLSTTNERGLRMEEYIVSYWMGGYRYERSIMAVSYDHAVNKFRYHDNPSCIWSIEKIK